jgi:putative hemolysin
MIGLTIALCWIASFFFNGIESGLLSIDPVRLRQNVKQGLWSALRLNRLFQQPERLLVTVLLVTNIADIIGLILLARLFVRVFGAAGFVWTLVLALPIYVFVLGVLPKALFRRFPFRALAALAGLLEFFVLVLSPVVELGAQLGRFMLPGRAEGRRLFAGRDELKQITSQSEREGGISATERAMIHNVVDFRGLVVSDVMVSLEKVVSVTPDTAIAEAVNLSAQSAIDRVPVIVDGEAKGLVNILDLLLEKDGATSVAPFMRRIVVAEENEAAYRIVQRLRAARLGLAAVINRQHQLRGIVTIEDLIRRLVFSTATGS